MSSRPSLEIRITIRGPVGSGKSTAAHIIRKGLREAFEVESLLHDTVKERHTEILELTAKLRGDD